MLQFSSIAQSLGLVNQLHGFLSFTFYDARNCLCKHSKNFQIDASAFYQSSDDVIEPIPVTMISMKLEFSHSVNVLPVTKYTP